jgi:hypothetical protein
LTLDGVAAWRRSVAGSLRTLVFSEALANESQVSTAMNCHLLRMSRSEDRHANRRRF